MWRGGGGGPQWFPDKGRNDGFEWVDGQEWSDGDVPMLSPDACVALLAVSVNAQQNCVGGDILADDA